MSSLSIKIGNFLFRNAFPVYNLVYPIFKNRQDKREISLMNEHIFSGATVLDIGANIGFYTNILSRLVGPQGHVYSFEPDRLNFDRLKKNCRHLTNVTLTNKAVSDKTDVLKIYKSLMLNVDHRTYPIDNYESVEEIPCVSMDEFLGAGKHVDFIKIDIQGFEMSAFSGMHGLLVENRDVKIISEFWPFGLKKAGSSTEQFLCFFWQQAFNVYLVNDTGFEIILPEHISYYSEMEESVYMNIFVTRNTIA